jgi:Flp pilus assembly protein TadB
VSPLLPGLAGALIVAGLIGVAAGTRARPTPTPSPRRRRPRVVLALARVSPRTRALLLTGLGAGLVVAVVTGWLLAVLVGPALLAGLPALLRPPPVTATIDRLEAVEEWTRALAGVLVAGVGLEQAIMATARSVPEPIRPEVTRLLARLHARWATPAALRAFAADLGDATGDLVAAQLIMGATRRGQGLAAVLEALAASVASDVRGRRAVEADRAKPRATARWVTLITIIVLGVLGVSGTYVAPYATGPGQAVLALLLSLYVATLLWMRAMTLTPPPPRILGESS